MPHGAEAGMLLGERGCDRRMIRLIAQRDSALDLGQRERSRVHRDPALREPPDEADAELGLARRCERAGPLLLHNRGVEIGDVPAGIDVGTREQRFDERSTDARRGGEERFDMRVLGFADE